MDEKGRGTVGWWRRRVVEQRDGGEGKWNSGTVEEKGSGTAGRWRWLVEQRDDGREG